MINLISFVYTTVDIASLNAANSLKSKINFKDKELNKMNKHIIEFSSTDDRNLNLIGIDSSLLYSEFLDSMDLDNIIFLSRHSSAMGVRSLTVHSLGNWNDKNELGGKPKELGFSNPEPMIKILKRMQGIKEKLNLDFEVTYEATHHGPLLKTPSLFAEFGGPESILSDKHIADLLADAVEESLDDEPEYENIAIGIGGSHYPTKFTGLALSGKYAFSHMMSRYYVDEVDMLEQAVNRSKIKAEIAVIEKKSMNSIQRKAILDKLEELGLDNVMV